MVDAQAEAVTGDSNRAGVTPDSDQWLAMARDAFDESTDWFDISLRPVIEKAMAHFANRHPPGSKYHSDSYKFRAKGFRPKTRSTIRRNEAAAAVAFFSTQDMVYVSAENEADQDQQMSAKVLTELLNYRLDDSIPWFQTLVGAYQDAMNVGVCISYQCWDYEEDVRDYPIPDMHGQPLLGLDGAPLTRTITQVMSDKPMCELVPIENMRISPASDWTNPMATTPYIVHLIPMFIGDVQQKMGTPDQPGEWTYYDEGTIKTAADNQYDSVRAARDGRKKADPKDINHTTGAFDTVWVHRNIIRYEGEDWIYYTLGILHRLTDPVRLTEARKDLARGERPYVMGTCLIETHKAYTTGLNELMFGLQEESNEVQNQRRDNVRLAMNKRYFARRGANIDYKSLTRNVPGSVTLVDDIQQDVRWDSPADVTGSAYQEQDRVSLDFDELAGTFSPGSVQSNRKLGETVGGMEMLSGDANVITEFQLRVFAETWVEKVLKQIVKLEQAYETDKVVMAIAGQKAKIAQKFGKDEVTDAMLQGSMTVRINVGFGSTNPEKRIGKLTMGLGTISAYMPMAMQKLSEKELVTEVFGALGYKGAERFFPGIDDDNEDPRIKQMQGVIQQLTQALQSKQMEVEGRVKVAEVTSEGRIKAIQAKAAADAEQAQQDRDLEKLLQEMQDMADQRKLTAEQEIWLKRLKVLLAQKAMEIRATQDLARAHVSADLLPAPPVEPPGTAAPGYSYQQ